MSASESTFRLAGPRLSQQHIPKAIPEIRPMGPSTVTATIGPSPESILVRIDDTNDQDDDHPERCPQDGPGQTDA
jgi:hypothetical protein